MQQSMASDKVGLRRAGGQRGWEGGGWVSYVECVKLKKDLFIHVYDIVSV